MNKVLMFTTIGFTGLVLLGEILNNEISLVQLLLISLISSILFHVWISVERMPKDTGIDLLKACVQCLEQMARYSPDQSRIFTDLRSDILMAADVICDIEDKTLDPVLSAQVSRCHAVIQGAYYDFLGIQKK